MSSPTTATLSGPSDVDYLVASTDFTVTLDQPADPGGVVVTVTDSVGGDTITTSPFTIAVGETSGTFTIKPSTYGVRHVRIDTAPLLTTIGSPRTCTVSPTTASLLGPSLIDCGVASSNFTVTLDYPAGSGGIEVTVTDSEASDTVTSSPFTIEAGTSIGSFTITPVKCGNRTISISLNPTLPTVLGTPRTASLPCNCPDDDGSVNRSQIWGVVAQTCPDAFSITVTTTPTDLWSKELYCTSSLLSMSITE